MTKRVMLITVAVLGVSWGLVGWAYPPARLIIPESDLIFSHSLHVTEMEIECEMCHPNVTESMSAHDMNLPTMDMCGECHDVEDDEACGVCHRDPEDILELPNPPRSIEFGHKTHLESDLSCAFCHGDVAGTEILSEAHFPQKPLCMNCHDGLKAGAECDACHGGRIALHDIHPLDWSHTHADYARSDRDWCACCHQQETDCIQCHAGDNADGHIHDLNYRFTHGLDADGKEADCRRCHDSQAFCNDCHLNELRMPLSHSTTAWISEHGIQACDDPENCAACHDSRDPSCARGGCHGDFDGVLGTDHRYHVSGDGLLDSKGPWHDDAGYFCYGCHIDTRQSSVGFCGYCHD